MHILHIYPYIFVSLFIHIYKKYNITVAKTFILIYPYILDSSLYGQIEIFIHFIQI